MGEVFQNAYCDKPWIPAILVFWMTFCFFWMKICFTVTVRIFLSFIGTYFAHTYTPNFMWIFVLYMITYFSFNHVNMRVLWGLIIHVLHVFI